MAVVYIDKVFMLNTVVDYLLLLTTAALAGTPLRRLRFALCAAIGGAYAVATFLLPLMGSPLLRMLFGGAIALLAFCRDTRPWRLIALFFLLSGALAGLILALGLAVGTPTGIMQRVYYADLSWGVLLGSSVIFYCLLHLLFRQGARYGGGDTVHITIAIQGKRCCVRALRDSGNTLRDPVRGQSVLVAEFAALVPLWGDEIQKILCSDSSVEYKMAQLSGKGFPFTLMPYKSVGEYSGLMLAVWSDYLQIGKRMVPRALVALTDTTIGNGCNALWGGREKEGAIHAALDQGEAQISAAVDRAG